MFYFHLVNASLPVLHNCGGDRGGRLLAHLLPSDLDETHAKGSGLRAELSLYNSDAAGTPFF